MDDTKNSALRAFRLIFRPVARILLRAGVTWREVVEVGKATYVDVASRDFGLRGRPTNISRVALMTGFTRREVRRLRDLLAGETPETFQRMNLATRLLSGWWQDDDFCDAAGRPVPLRRDGDSPSFESLCSRYGSDVAATTILKELMHVGAVVENDDGLLEARLRYYMPVLMDPEQMLRSGSVLEDIGTTVAWNLHRQETEPSRFERRATNTRMSRDDLAAFRDFIEQEGQAFLERVDAWLTDHERNDGDASIDLRLGVGTYWIEDNLQERDES